MRKTLSYLAIALLLYTILSKPLEVSAPQWRLDESYAWAINFLTATGSWSEHEILFTYGPLGFVMEPRWYPLTVVLSVLVQALFSAALGVIFFLLFRKQWIDGSTLQNVLSLKAGSIILCALFLLYLFHCSRVFGFDDKLILVFLGLLTLHRLYGSPGYYYGAVVCAVVAFFVKLSFLVLFIPLLVSTVYGFLTNTLSMRQWRNAALMGIGLYFAMSLGFFQSLEMLYLYPRAAYELAHGNQSAMSYSDSDFGFSWMYFWLFWLLIIIVVLASERPLKLGYLLTFVVTGYFMFLYGMSRSDHAHEWFSFTLAACMFFVPLSKRPLWVIPPSVLSMVFLYHFLAASPASGRIQLQIIDLLSVHRTLAPPLQTVGTSWRTIADRLTQQSRVPETSRPMLGDSLYDLLKQEQIDIYPHEAARAFQYGLRWSPRPVFQSYLAYRPWLVEQNVLFFQDASRRPAYLLWHSFGPTKTLTSIDERYFLNDEIPTFLEMVKRYDLFDVFADGFVLREREVPQEFVERGVERGVMRGLRLDDTSTAFQKVDQKGDFAVARFEIRRTAQGSLVRTMYKEFKVVMLYRLENGWVVKHRIIPDLLSSAGVWLSPYLTTDDTLADFLKKKTAKAGIRVDAVGIRFEKESHYEQEIPFEYRWYAFK